MEDRLRDQASTWTLQNDDDLRKNLESLRDNVTNTANHLTVNIEKLHDKLLNTDCGVEQLNTQLDLLKNAKFVENIVEDEDSRPKPPVLVPQKTKEEMVQIVVDAVKVNLNKIVGQLTCERLPRQIENIPNFNHPDFASYSFIPPEYKRKPVERQREENISTNLIDPPLPPPDLPSPSHIPKIDPQLEQKSAEPPLNGIIKPIVVNNPSDSEDETDHRPQNNVITQPSMSSVPPAPDLSKFNGVQRKPVVQAAKPRNLFSSDDEDEEEGEVPFIAPASVPQVTMPIKPQGDLMEQLAAKLKSKEAKLKERPAPVPEKQVAPPAPSPVQSPTVKEVEAPPAAVKQPPKVEIMRKRSEPKPALPTPASRATTLAAEEQKPLPPKEEDLPSTSKQPAKVETQRASAAESSTSARAAPRKTRGLFSDSDSDGDFMVTKTMPPTKPAIGQRKVEVPKLATKKVLSTKKKSIFDSDSSDDDGFASFLKKPVTQEKKFSTGLVTQRNPRPPSPVKESPLKPPVKEEPRPVKAAPLPEPVKETSASLPTKEEPPPTKKTPSPEPVKEEPLKPQVKEEPVPVKSAPVPQPVKVKVEPPARKVQEEKSKPPEPSTPVTHSPAAGRRPSLEPSTSSDPLSVDLLSEEVKTTKAPAAKESVVSKTTATQENNIKPEGKQLEKKEPVPDSPQPIESPPVVQQKEKTPGPKVEPEKTPTAPVQRKASSPDHSAAEAPPPVPENFRRSESPPDEEASRSDQAPLEQDNLPPIPTQEFPSDSPPEPAMPVGKTPGKLNNAGFAAMLGNKLQAGPPGTRTSTSPMSTSATSIAEAPASTSPTTPRETASSSTTTSPAGLCHLTKSRPRRPGVHRPSLHKESENGKDKDTTAVDKVNNGVATMKVSSTPPNVRKETALAAAASAAVKAKATTSAAGEKSPSIVKRTSSASKIDNGLAKEVTKPAASTSASKAAEKPAAKANIISASASRTLPAKKGLFDFSSSDEDQLPPQKITKAAATLKTSVTSTSSIASSSSKTASSSSVNSASKTTTAGSTAPVAGASTDSTGSAKPAFRGLNKYKSMFNDDDDLDVSLFKKS